MSKERLSKRWKRDLQPTRRDVLIGGVALSVGILGTLVGVSVGERLNAEQSALTPEKGQAESHLSIAWLPDTVTRWRPKIEHYGDQYHIDPNLIAIIMTVESGGDPHASSGIAKGLMQITDPTAADIAHRILPQKRDTYDLNDPDTSIEFGAAYLKHLTQQYGNLSQGPSWDETVTLVSAAYNGGYAAGNAYQQHGWQGLTDYDQQTLHYARYVHVMWQERHDPLSFAYRYWYDAANGKQLVDQAGKYTMPK